MTTLVAFEGDEVTDVKNFVFVVGADATYLNTQPSFYLKKWYIQVWTADATG